MLDLCFVLLVIFMITTPLMENSNQLALPNGADADHPVDAGKVHTVGVDRSLAITLDGDPVAAAQLTGRLEALRTVTPDVAVVVRAHRELTLQQLVGVMDSLRAAQIVKVGIVTEQAGGNAVP